MEAKSQNVFVSHYHGDDTHVDNLTGMLAGQSYNLRNSSIRKWRPENQERWKGRKVNDETIKRLLRRKITWAGSVLVLIGKETASRPWVNWEIEEASRQGKQIIGIYIRGGADSDIPEAFKKYGTTLVGWNTEKIIEAISGEGITFQNSDGTPKPNNLGPRGNC